MNVGTNVCFFLARKLVHLCREKERSISSVAETCGTHPSPLIINATYGAGELCCLSTVLMCVDEGENIYGCQWNANQAYPIETGNGVDLL